MLSRHLPSLYLQNVAVAEKNSNHAAKKQATAKRHDNYKFSVDVKNSVVQERFKELVAYCKIDI